MNLDNELSTTEVVQLIELRCENKHIYDIKINENHLLSSTNNSNMLPMVKHGKCEGCSKTAKDTEVLHCYLCNNYFHATNCTVVEALGKGVTPSPTNLINYIKFSALSYPTGRFIWTCLRCGCIEQLASKGNMNQRVALLESLFTMWCWSFSM